MKQIIYTIGHSTYTVEKFINLLKAHNITCIVDVRSTPYSQFAPQFNERDIKFFLNKNGITYIYMGKEFGARREDAALYRNSGKLDFEKTKSCPEFISGVKRIENGLRKGFNIAMMCSEKVPQDCHRCIMIGKAFSDYGYEVEHILEDSSLLQQADIDQLLLDEYFPNRDQLSLFDCNDMSEIDYISAAYRKKEEEIAYDKSTLKEGSEE